MAQPVLQVSHVTKNYQQFTAVDDISFDLNQGEILGLLGPNGAGKTTTIQMLLGLTTPDAGTIHYFGKDFAHQREFCLSRLNFASAYSQLQGKLSARQNLEIYAGLYEVKDAKARIAYLTDLLGIAPHLDTLFNHLSSGQKTRTIWAKALLNRPQILLMDEPTASLDPEIVHKMIDLIRELKAKEGISILFTSHNMDEVARLCDRVMFLYAGKVVVTDTPVNLSKMVKDTSLILTFEGKKTDMKDYLERGHYQHTFIRPELVEILVTEEDLPKVLFGLTKTQLYVTGIDIEKPTLEDAFLSIASKGHHALATS